MLTFTALRRRFLGCTCCALFALAAIPINLISVEAQPANRRPLALIAITRVASGNEAEFLKENETAMSTMMAGMTVRPTGDVDRDFVAMMVPHHQGAVDMARAELRYGHNSVLLRMAQEIVVEQDQEIAVLRGVFSTTRAP